MTMAKEALAAEIAILLILGVVVEWIATRLTHTRNFYFHGQIRHTATSAA